MHCPQSLLITSRFRRQLVLGLALAAFGLSLCADANAQPPGGRRGFFDNTRLSSLGRQTEVVEALALTDDQKIGLELLLDGVGERMRGLERDQFGPVMQQIEEEALALLTDSQKQKFAENKEQWSQQYGGRGFGGRGPGGGPPSDGPPSGNAATSGNAAPAGGSASTVAAAPKVPRVAPVVRPQPGTSPIVSFGGPVVASAEQPQNRAGEATLSFNFRYAPWADVLTLFAETAGLTLDLHDVPPGTFNYYDNEVYTATEALDVLNGYLLPNGYVLIRRDKFLVSLNIDNGIPPNLVPSVTLDELSKRGRNELVSLVVPVNGLDATNVVGEIKELLGPQGKAAALKNTNSIVVTDIASNVERIAQLLQGSQGLENKDSAFRAIALKHITASEAERMIRRLFGLNPTTVAAAAAAPAGPANPWEGRRGRGRFGGGNDNGVPGPGGNPPPAPVANNSQSSYAGKIHVTADARTNHLLVTASAALVKVVEDAVKSIDTDTDALGNKVLANDDKVEFKVYSVTGGDVAQIARTLNTLLPTILVMEDTSLGKLHVQASESEHVEVETLIKQLSGTASNSVSVIQLAKSDPLAVANTLENLFAGETRPPSFEADANGRRLIARGTPEQLQQVKLILTQLGETGEDGGRASSNSRVRTLNLGGRDFEEVLPLLKEAWSATSDSPIRVVIPSQPALIRDRRIPGAASRMRESESANETERTPRAAPTRRRPRPADATPATEAGLDQGAEPAPRRSDLIAGRPRFSLLSTSRSRAADTRSRSHATPVLLAADAQPVNDDATAFDAATARPGDGAMSGDAAVDFPLPDGAVDALRPANSALPGLTSNRAVDDAVGVSVMNGELIITSEDPKSLDRLEEVFQTLIAALPPRTRWTVFYLQSADATEAAQMLERLFPQSSVTASTRSSDGLMGSIGSSFNSIGRGVLSSSGLGKTLNGSQSLRIVTELRSNALFVSGPADQVRQVEDMLRLLDSPELPQSLRDRLPREIAVEFADVEEVAQIVRDIYKDALEDQNAQQMPGGRNFNPLAALMGGQNAQAGGKARGPQLTIGVDKRTSHLIVSSNDSMFRQIEALVHSIDDRAHDARETVRVVPLATADPLLVSTTLSSLMPKVTVSGSVSRTHTTTSDSSNNGNGNTAANPPGGGNDAGRDADIMRRMMEQRSRMPQTDGGNAPGGGGTGRRFGGNGGGGNGGATGGGTGGGRGRGNRGGSRN